MTWRLARPTRSRPVPPTRWVPVVVVLALVAATITGLTATPPAQAATTVGSLKLTPGTGTKDSPISVETVSSGSAKGCPEPTTNVIGYLSGPGVWATPIIAITRTDIGVSTTTDFTAEFADTIGGLAVINSRVIVPGVYTLTLRCSNSTTANYGEFTGTLTFSDTTNYTSVDTTGPGPTPTPTPTPTVQPTNPTGAVPTTTSLAASPAGTSAQGSTVTLNATVTPSTAVGRVTFRDGDPTSGTVLGSATVVGGQAAVATAGLVTGGHSLVAVFEPASTQAFGASTSAAVAYTVTASAGVPVVGSLKVDPANGTADDPFRFRTVSSPGRTPGCPTDSTNYRGTVTGPGDWASPVLLITGSEIGLSTTEDFTVEAADTFGGIATINGLQIVPGRYDISLLCLNGARRIAQFTGSMWFTDSERYQSTDPANSQSQTQVTLVVTPADRADLGTPVTLSATVTPSNATGTLQFSNSVNGTSGNVGPPLVVNAGGAGLVAEDLDFGLYQFAVSYIPADVKRFAPSSSTTAVFVAAKSVPPVPKKAHATISGTVKVGKTLTCAADFAKADSRKWRWFQGWDKQIGSAKTYKVKASDKGKKLRCQALASNEGGTTYRYSKTVSVPR